MSYCCGRRRGWGGLALGLAARGEGHGRRLRRLARALLSSPQDSRGRRCQLGAQSLTRRECYPRAPLPLSAHHSLCRDRRRNFPTCSPNENDFFYAVQRTYLHSKRITKHSCVPTSEQGPQLIGIFWTRWTFNINRLAVMLEWLTKISICITCECNFMNKFAYLGKTLVSFRKWSST